VPLDSDLQAFRLRAAYLLADVSAAMRMIGEMADSGMDIMTRHWVYAIKALGKAGDSIGALALFYKAHSDGRKPTHWLFQTVATVCRETGDLRGALDVLNHARQVKAGIDTSVYNTIVGACIDANKPEKALTILGEMVKDGAGHDWLSHSYTVLAYGKLGQWQKAVAAFDAAGFDHGGKLSNIPPERLKGAFMSVMHSCARWGRLDITMDLFNRMRRAGIKPTTMAYNHLLTAYCRAGNLVDGMKVMEEMEKEGLEPDLITYNALLGESAKHGRLEEALQLFRDLKCRGLPADNISYFSVIRACNPQGLWSVGMYMYDEVPFVLTDAGSQTEPFKTTVGLLDRVGAEAMGLFAKDLYRKAVEGGVVRHWSGTKGENFLRMDLHYFSRSMAKVALQVVLDDIVRLHHEQKWPTTRYIKIADVSSGEEEEAVDEEMDEEDMEGNSHGGAITTPRIPPPSFLLNPKPNSDGRYDRNLVIVTGKGRTTHNISVLQMEVCDYLASIHPLLKPIPCPTNAGRLILPARNLRSWAQHQVVDDAAQPILLEEGTKS